MTKNQHYVPQFYLKYFCNDDGMLCAYDTNNCSFKKIAPANICFEKYLYETKADTCNVKIGKYLDCNTIEHTFCNYEGKYSKLLKRIISICSNKQNENALVLTTSEKDILCHFVINMLIRNPKSMELLEVDSLPEEITNSDLFLGLKDALDKMNIGGTESIFKAAQKRALLTYELADDNPLVNTISKLDYSFFLATEGEFITSDMPVCFGNDIYIKADNATCLYTALSPKVAVLFGNYPNLRNRRNRIVPIKKGTVYSFNKQFIAKKHYIRWLIACSESNIRKVV